MKRTRKAKKLQVKKNDTVFILAGKDKGKQGRVLELDYKMSRITVEGVNMAKKTVRPSQQNPKGGIIDMAQPLHISNVMLLCPKCGKPAKVARKSVNDKRVRVCTKCSEIIDKT